MDDDKFPKFISPFSVLNTKSLRSLTLTFNKFTASAADLLIKFFRDCTLSEYRRTNNIRALRLEYNDREREAVLQVMSGILKDNPFLEEFELVSTNGYTFLNVNNFIENFEDYYIGKNLKKLTLRESFKFNEKSKFLEEGTENLEELTINKSVLN